MHNWIKKTLIAVFGLSLLTGALGACSRGHHSNWNAEDAAAMGDKVADKLDLNASQRQKLDLLTDQLLTLRNHLKTDTNGPRSELASLFGSDQLDRSLAQSLLEQKTAVMQQDGPEVITALADFYDSLRPAQQQQIRDKLERRKGWFNH